jgi:aspartate-semialdehyde dehydrogenase
VTPETDRAYAVAVAGATGAVGTMMVRILEERGFPVGSLRLLASDRSAGKRILFRGAEHIVEPLRDDSFEGIDIALFSAGAERSLRFAHKAVASGAVVVDNSSAFRMDPFCPLIVPEVNLLRLAGHRGIVSNPNCSTIQLVMALAPIHRKAKVTRVVVSTYQSVSGTGRRALEELTTQERLLLERDDPGLRGAEGSAPGGRPAGRAPVEVPHEVYPRIIARNLLPQVDDFREDAFTKEEHKVRNETRRILEDDSIRIVSTCVRVPVRVSHSESVYIETAKKVSAADARKWMAAFPGVVVLDDPGARAYPTPLECEGRDEVFVGRVREDPDVGNGLHLWVVSDNLRKGAALNAVQIAEHLVKSRLLPPRERRPARAA